MLLDYYQRLDCLIDLKDFYTRHCDSTDHFYMLTADVIRKHRDEIRPQIIERLTQKKVNYNILRL